jgi:hypothetical protein
MMTLAPENSGMILHQTTHCSAAGTTLGRSSAVSGTLKCSAASLSPIQKATEYPQSFHSPETQGKTHTDGDFSLLIMCSRLSFQLNCSDCPAQKIRRIEFLK